MRLPRPTTARPTTARRAGLPVLLALALVAATGAAQAQGAAEPAGTANAAAARRNAPPLRAAPGFCDTYGAGFVRVEGTDTCLKAAGSVETNATTTSGSTSVRGSAIAPALRSR